MNLIWDWTLEWPFMGMALKWYWNFAHAYGCSLFPRSSAIQKADPRACISSHSWRKYHLMIAPPSDDYWTDQTWELEFLSPLLQGFQPSQFPHWLCEFSDVLAFVNQHAVSSGFEEAQRMENAKPYPWILPKSSFLLHFIERRRVSRAQGRLVFRSSVSKPKSVAPCTGKDPLLPKFRKRVLSRLFMCTTCTKLKERRFCLDISNKLWYNKYNE